MFGEDISRLEVSPMDGASVWMDEDGNCLHWLERQDARRRDDRANGWRLFGDSGMDASTHRVRSEDAGAS